MNAVIENLDAGEPEAQRLIAELDCDLNQRYPGEQTNGINVEEFRAVDGYFVVVRAPESRAAVACGAFRPVSPHCVEMKRMYVHSSHRRRGYARIILQHLEAVARGRGFRGFVLETGMGQPEAIALYEAVGYFRIPNYGHYADNPNSVCFAKQA